MNKSHNLHDFLGEYLLLAEIAYIERNGPVISILPSIIAAAARSANGAEMQETLNKKGNEGKMLQMLLYAGLRNDETANQDEEHIADPSRFFAVANYIQQSNDELQTKLSEFNDPHSHPLYWDKAREMDITPTATFNPAIIYLLSSSSSKPISLEELIFLMQAAPQLSTDPMVPYLFVKDSDGHQKLRTYLMAIFLTPEIFSNGPSMSAAMALLSNT